MEASVSAPRPTVSAYPGTGCKCFAGGFHPVPGYGFTIGDMSAGLRAGQVATAAGVNRETLRYYERRGLLVEPDRSLGGHRLYPVETVHVLRVIKAAQRLGFTLDEVADLLAVGAHRHGHRGNDAGLLARAKIKRTEVEQKIADLGVIRDTLRAAVHAGCDDLRTCAQSPCCPLPFNELAAPVDHQALVPAPPP